MIFLSLISNAEAFILGLIVGLVGTTISWITLDYFHEKDKKIRDSRTPERNGLVSPETKAAGVTAGETATIQSALEKLGAATAGKTLAGQDQGEYTKQMEEEKLAQGRILMEAAKRPEVPTRITHHGEKPEPKVEMKREWLEYYAMPESTYKPETLSIPVQRIPKGHRSGKGGQFAKQPRKK